MYLPVLFVLGLFMLNACKDDEKEPEPDAKTTYTADAAPILNGSCNFSGCHNNGSANGSMANYDAAKLFGKKGGFLKRIKHEEGVNIMPPDATKKLSDAKIATLEKWIADGLLE